MTEKEVQKAIDNKTKPPGSLGQLERLAKHIALIQGSLKPELKNPVMLVFAADHGLATEGVSLFPQEVTYQMVLNFLQGGAAINVFTQNSGMNLKVIDAGVKGTFPEAPGLIHAKIAEGTASSLRGPAMTKEQCAAALDKGAALMQEELYRGCNVVGFGEMGIGNTSAAALLMHRFGGFSLEDCTGAGTGLDDNGIHRKLKILKGAAEANRTAESPREILAALGGLEIAMMTGAMIRAAEEGAILLIDGFIASSALMAADAIQPGTKDKSVYCHCSNESGHRKMLDFLGGEPLLNLGLRLGEGTGAALAYPLVRAAAAFLKDMASFEEAGVSRESSD